MSFLSLGIADIYQTIHTLNNSMTDESCFRVHIHDCLFIIALCHWWSSSFYIIKVTHSYCDTIAIGDISYRQELIWSQSSTYRFKSPWASESALLYTHRVRNCLMIAANNRTLNLTTPYWSQISSILQLSYFAIYQMERITRHSGHMNRKAHSPQAQKVWSK